MKLIIKRDQKAQTGMLGGHKGMTFILSCQVDLTPEEKALISKYKAEGHPLTFTTDRDGNKLTKDTISRLMQGTTEEMKDITILLNNEAVGEQKQSKNKWCQALKIDITPFLLLSSPHGKTSWNRRKHRDTSHIT